MPLLAAVVVGAVAGSIAAVVVLRHDTKHPSHSGAATRNVSRSAAAACQGTLALRVDVAPSIAIPVAAIAKNWAATRPSAGGRCIDVTVKAVDPAKEANQLASAASSDAAVWIPDSSLWAEQLSADGSGGAGTAAIVHIGASIAATPLVLVASPSEAANQTNTSTTTGWRAIVAGKVPATIPDPTANTDGLLGLLAMRAAVGGNAPTPSTQLVGAMIGISHAALPNAAAGFAKLAATPRSTPLFAASEQEVINANTARHAVFAAAVYPVDGTLSLDYPVVRLSRAGEDAALASAVAGFERQLNTATARAQFSAAGLRDAAGVLTGVGAAQGVRADKVTQLPKPTITQAQDTLRMWSAASEDSRLLAVIDVSGSMSDPAGNGQTKIQLVVAAAETAVGFFPQTSDLGLWVFSTNQTSTTDWAQLVPLGRLTTMVGTVSRRQALLAAAAQMPGRVKGNTALYETTLAAFENVRNTYDPSKVNTLVLMTDGQNVNPGGITLDQLVSTLRSRVDPSRPVPIITIGIGTDVDAAALQAISAVTGGKTYLVKNPTDIRSVFLDAIIQRQCRPNC